MIILSAGKNFSIPSYATQILHAFCASNLFVTPAKFCSCIKVGTPIMPATFNVGPLAYPPTPTATCGLNSFRIRRAFHWLRNNLIITAKFFHKRLRSKPATGRPIIYILHRAHVASPFVPSAPTKRISASGRSSLMALAIDTAGNICPLYLHH